MSESESVLKIVDLLKGVYPNWEIYDNRRNNPPYPDIVAVNEISSIGIEHTRLVREINSVNFQHIVQKFDNILKKHKPKTDKEPTQLHVKSIDSDKITKSAKLDHIGGWFSGGFHIVMSPSDIIPVIEKKQRKLVRWKNQYNTYMLVLENQRSVDQDEAIRNVIKALKSIGTIQFNDVRVLTGNNLSNNLLATKTQPD